MSLIDRMMSRLRGTDPQTLDARGIAPSAGMGYGIPPGVGGRTAHRAANRTESNLKDWTPALQSADAELSSEKDAITARQRDLIRSNGFAAGARRTEVDSVLGSRGLRLSARPDWKALGKTKAWADQWSATMHSLWRSWAEDPLECDVSGVLDMADQATVHYLGAWGNGDSFALAHWRDPSEARYSNRKWALCFQGIEADRVVNPQRGMDTSTLRGGIEIDEFGAPQAYNIAKIHPGDNAAGMYLSASSYGLVETDRIPAYTDWGRRRVVHIIERSRFGQTRAAGVLTPVLAQFKNIDTVMDASLKKSILNNLLALIITTPVEDIRDWFPPSLSAADGTQDDLYTKLSTASPPALKSGSTLRLRPGETAQAFNPAGSDAQLDPFVNIFIREIAAACGSTYELLTKDFTKSNYSSIRAALVESWRYFSGKRYWLATAWHQHAYEMLAEEAAHRGLIDASDFYANKHAYCRAEWLGAARGLIDPVRELSAAALKIESMLGTYEDYYADQGKDWVEEFEQIALERQWMDAHNLPHPTAAITIKQQLTQNQQDDQATLQDDGTQPAAPAPPPPTDPAPKPAPKKQTPKKPQP